MSDRAKSLGERLLNWMLFRGKAVRDGGLFHELDQMHLPSEAIEEAAEKVKAKTRGYRNG